MGEKKRIRKGDRVRDAEWGGKFTGTVVRTSTRSHRRWVFVQWDNIAVEDQLLRGRVLAEFPCFYLSKMLLLYCLSTMKSLVFPDGVEQRIYLLRGHRVMLDRDLAVLYGVKAIALRQQIKRNRERFPSDFMFQLSKKEAELLVSPRM